MSYLRRQVSHWESWFILKELSNTEILKGITERHRVVMKIKYTNILDDHINFSKHHRGESKTSKELVIWTLILCSLLFIYGKMSEFQYLSYIIIGLLLFVLLIVLSPYFWNKLIHKESAKLFEDKENKGFFGFKKILIFGKYIDKYLYVCLIHFWFKTEYILLVMVLSFVSEVVFWQNYTVCCQLEKT